MHHALFSKKTSILPESLASESEKVEKDHRSNFDAMDEGCPAGWFFWPAQVREEIHAGNMEEISTNAVVLMVW